MQGIRENEDPDIDDSYSAKSKKTYKNNISSGKRFIKQYETSL
jgi:hypothetical protein